MLLSPNEVCGPVAQTPHIFWPWELSCVVLSFLFGLRALPSGSFFLFYDEQHVFAAEHSH